MNNNASKGQHENKYLRSIENLPSLTTLTRAIMNLSEVPGELSLKFNLDFANENNKETNNAFSGLDVGDEEMKTISSLLASLGGKMGEKKKKRRK